MDVYWIHFGIYSVRKSLSFVMDMLRAFKNSEIIVDGSAIAKHHELASRVKVLQVI